MKSPEFRPWPKTPRLSGASMVITEKIDGTNACIIVTEDGQVAAQSRKRIITPDDDNFGFARWVQDRMGALAEVLGPGYHYGEWWGSGIQRGYGLTNGERTFSLFNTGRWADELWKSENEGIKVEGLDIVPVLYHGQLNTPKIQRVVDELVRNGSYAAPFFPKPEGVIVYIPRLDKVFKVLTENNDIPKSIA